MKRLLMLSVLAVAPALFGGCAARVKQCTSSRKYNPGFRLEVRVPESTAVQIVTVPPDGVVTIEVPGNIDCNAVVITPLPDSAAPQ